MLDLESESCFKKKKAREPPHRSSEEKPECIIYSFVVQFLEAPALLSRIQTQGVSVSHGCSRLGENEVGRG